MAAGAGRERGKEEQTYGVLPYTGARYHVATRRVPIHVRDSVVVARVHELEVRGEVLVAFRLLSLEIEIPKVEVEALLRVDRRHDDETPLWRPVNRVAVLLLNGAYMFEVADAGALYLFGAEEGYGRLWRHGGRHDDFGGGDEDEAVALWLPGEVDDGVFDRVDDLDRHALFPHAEDFEVRRERFLRFRVPVDLDANVGALRLPVEFCVGDVEEVARADDLFGGNAHEADFGGVAANLGRPEAEELLVGLDRVALREGGGPFEVHDAFDFDGCFVHEGHLGELIDGYRLPFQHAGDESVVGRPFECGPWDLLLDGLAGLALRRGREVVHLE